MKLKNILLSLGSIGTIVTPLAAVIACGDKNDETKESTTQNKDTGKTDDQKTTEDTTGFDFTSDLAMFVDVISTKENADLDTNLANKSAGDVVTANDLGITTPTLSTNDVIAKYELVANYDDNAIDFQVKVTLTKGSEIESKEIKVSLKKTELQEAKELLNEKRKTPSFQHFYNDLNPTKKAELDELLKNPKVEVDANGKKAIFFEDGNTTFSMNLLVLLIKETIELDFGKNILDNDATKDAVITKIKDTNEYKNLTLDEKTIFDDVIKKANATIDVSKKGEEKIIFKESGFFVEYKLKVKSQAQQTIQPGSNSGQKPGTTGGAVTTGGNSSGTNSSQNKSFQDAINILPKTLTVAGAPSTTFNYLNDLRQALVNAITTNIPQALRAFVSNIQTAWTIDSADISTGRVVLHDQNDQSKPKYTITVSQPSVTWNSVINKLPSSMAISATTGGIANTPSLLRAIQGEIMKAAFSFTPGSAISKSVNDIRTTWVIDSVDPSAKTATLKHPTDTTAPKYKITIT